MSRHKFQIYRIPVQVVKNTTVHIRGYDKVAVGQFAADIRFKRPPEPYKGKGVRYQDEFVPKKEGKGGKKWAQLESLEQQLASCWLFCSLFSESQVMHKI